MQNKASAIKLWRIDHSILHKQEHVCTDKTWGGMLCPDKGRAEQVRCHFKHLRLFTTDTREARAEGTVNKHHS